VSTNELRTLLILELEKHLAGLLTHVNSDRSAQSGQLRHALHALKGGARLAGEAALGDALGRMERSLSQNVDAVSHTRARALLESARDRLKRGESGFADTWPTPPADMGVAQNVAPFYRAELAERVTRVEDVVRNGMGDAINSAKEVARELHTIKGAAGAIGDETLSWFVHGLEERVKRVAADAGSAEQRAELQLHEAVRYLATLRMHALAEVPKRRKGDSTQLSSVRVQSASIDALLERMQNLRNVEHALLSRRASLREDAKQVRDLRRDVADALRLIGPPKPWGAPAAAIRTLQQCAATLSTLGTALEENVASAYQSGEQLSATMRGVSKDLSEMRQGSVRELFQRLALGAQLEAKKLDKLVVVETRGAAETLDRKILEGLLDPCMHLVRNCIAHGIETSEERKALGKSDAGVIRLEAQKRSGRLLLSISDDGRGVDVGAVHARALSEGLIDADHAGSLSEDAILSLLLSHGFSMRSNRDEVSGTGIGLDAVVVAVRRLGGTVSLENQAGLLVHLQVPLEPLGVVRVLWVQSGQHSFAFPAQDVLRIVSPPEAGSVHLAQCLAQGTAEARVCLLLDERGTQVGVDEVREIESVVIRPLSSLAARLGPFLGGVGNEHDAVRFVLDPLALKQRIQALSRRS
jgi:two-component system, chemotaxis family, sensor kinase CheA